MSWTCGGLPAGAIRQPSEPVAPATVATLPPPYRTHLPRRGNRPGAGAAALRKLADAGVNVDLLLPVRISDEVFYAVICADDVAAAERALGGQVVKQ